MSGERLYRFGAQAGWHFAIIIPARNEQGRILACLSALALSMSRCHLPGGLVLVVNNSTDRTAEIAQAWMGRHPAIPAGILDCHAPQGLAGVGWARHRGMEVAASALRADGILMTSDADASVDAEWIAANIGELQRADLICGRVEPDRAELADLPARFLRHGPAEGRYIQMLLQLIERLDPLAHDPAPVHRNAAGASLAFPLRLYRDVGGMPCLPVREDREFVAAAEMRDWRVRYAQTPLVRASCRLTGRTGGGMAAALRARIDEDDPLCDEFVEPAGRAILRYSLRRSLREAWHDPQALRRTLAASGLEAPPGKCAYFGTFLRQIEQSMPALAPIRLRQSQLASQIRLLEDWLCGNAGMTEVA